MRRKRLPTKRTASRKSRRPPVKAQPRPAAVAVPSGLLEGVALFNHHQFFACHEALEQVWLRTEGRAKDFYKGLIQAAVAFHHWSKGNQAGAMSLYRSSSGYLRRYTPDFLGVDVAGFLKEYTELFGWLRRHRLRYDAHLVPVMHWAHPVRAV